MRQGGPVVQQGRRRVIKGQARSWAGAFPTRRGWAWALLLALGMTILLHGCHGEDEDHELFRRQEPEQIWMVN